MQLRYELQNKFSSLKIYQDIELKRLLIKPSGIVNPSLIIKDLEEAYAFGSELQEPWDYIVDTTDVLFPNPLNLIYLRKIRSLPHMENYVILSSSKLFRLMAILTSFIIKPDLIIQKMDQLATNKES